MTIEEVPTVKIRQARKEIENFQDQLSQLEQAREEKIENYASSRDRQYELASLRDEIVQKLAIAEKSNKAAFFRHQGELEKIIVEMETAEVLSNKLKSEIEKLEYDLEVAKINGHVFEGRENEVEAFEKEVQNYEKDLADYRLEQEKKLADNSMRQMRRQIEQNQADKAESERYQLEMNRKSEAAFNNLKPIMHESLQKQRKMEKAQADEKFREQNRMAKSVNDLKDTLQKNTENYHVGLRKKAVRDKRETSPEEAIQELMEKHDMLEDMATILYENQKRNQLWEQELEHRKKERQQREEEIIMKLRRENQFLKKTESKQRTERLLNRDRNDPNLLKKKNLTQQVRRIRQLEHYRRPFSAESSSGSVLEGIGSSRDFVMSQHSKSFVDEEIHLSEDYAPLWDGVAPHDEENLSYKPVSAKQVANLTDKIVADPSTIDFLDFDLQKEYTINVTLTNAANEKTPIRLARLSDNVMDLCSWDFTVLPSISPGISVNFQISFYPQMLESIDGYAEFKTLFGVFKLPIKMRPPKYEPRISHDQVEFGNVILGETMQKEIRIENVGALGGQISVDFSNLSDEFEVIPRFEHLKLPPKDTKKLIIKWTPKTEGHFNLPLFIETNVSFDDKKKLEISGHASLLPVNLSHHTLDFKVCSYGFLYQNQFTIHNSSNVSQPFSFNIPQNLQNAITISPQTGSVQAHASSKIHVKFTPTVDSSFDHFLDEDTSVLEFPLDVSFQNFQKPLTTTIYAIINDPSLKIEENCLNFGNTTIFESTVHRVKITSRSLLLEEFGFSELPNFVSVRPGHGFASLAPSETMEIDIVFSPMQASKYEFTIILETLKGFKHRFKCTGVGVKPPLEISNQHLKLSTPLFSVNRATFTLSNTHTSRDEFSRPVARIGNGKIFPVTSTSFSFMPPEDCNLHFSPSVGVLKPGESVLVTVTHEPFISEERIYEMGRSFPPPEAQVPSEPAQSSKKSIKGSKLPSKTPSRVSSRRESRQSSNSVSRVSSASTIPPPPVEKNDARYCKAKSILSENFGERRDRFSIPCYISSEDVSKGRSWKNPSFDSGYCLFIDAELETTRPALVLENGMDVINMGPRPVGTTEKHYFYLKNRSNSFLEIATTPLNPSGPFILANPVPRKLSPGEKARILIKFTPTNAQVYHDYLYLNYSKLDGIICPQRLELLGRGQNIDAWVDGLSPQNEMPTVLLGGESYLETEMTNQSTFPISFSIIPSNDNSIDHNRNRNGKSVFDVAPASGIIPPNGKRDLKITFRPDHAGHFTEVFTLKFCDTDESTRVYRVHGYCSPTDVLLRQVDHFEIIFSDIQQKQAGSGFTNPDKYEQVINHGPIMIKTKLNDLSTIKRPEYTASFEIKTLTPSPSRSSSKASKQKKEKTSKSGPSSYEFILPADFDGQVFPDLSGQLEGEITKFDIRLRSKPSSLPIHITVNTSQTVKYQIFLQSD